MPRGSERTARTRRPARAPEPEPLADRELRNPYFRWLVHLGVPLTVSLLVHVLLFAGLALRSWQVFGGSGLDLAEYEVEIRDSSRSEFSDGLKWPGEHLLDLTEPDLAADVDPFRFSELVDRSDLNELARREPSALPGELGSGGFGIGESGRSGVLGIGEGAGGGGGGGFGRGFGTGSGLGKAGVWNVNASGNTFAYVVDFSGSIIVAVDDLKRELKRSIGKLTSRQLFAVFIFYSTGDQRAEHFKTEAFAPELQIGTPDAKRKFFAWIDRKAPMGSTQPLPAMKRALALKPDAVFFFSDGYFDDKVVAEIAKANKRSCAQIHCLVFDELLLQDTSGLPRLTDGARRLKRIADQSGGKTKIVTGADLGR
ncbi:MAG: hypothetical protein ACE5I3_04245 [Phycisphaerae bacterium]